MFVNITTPLVWFRIVVCMYMRKELWIINCVDDNYDDDVDGAEKHLTILLTRIHELISNFQIVNCAVMSDLFSDSFFVIFNQHT